MTSRSMQHAGIPVLPNGAAGAVHIFADGATIDSRQHTTDALHGADGLAFDVLGNIYCRRWRPDGR